MQPGIMHGISKLAGNHKFECILLLIGNLKIKTDNNILCESVKIALICI